MPPPARIDVHAHFLPPFYREACLETDNAKPDGFPVLPEWDEESHLELMRQHSISKAILSISSPGVNLVSKDGKVRHELARRCNSFAAEVVKRNPQKFGFWASLPLPNIKECLEEINYARDHLHANGFSIETNHHGVYVGDPSLDVIFDELNKIKATLFIHPTTPCSRSSNCTIPGDVHHVPAVPLPQYPNPVMEFLFDTTRALINLFTSGTLARCPDITFIIPHAGGALPPLLQRFSVFGSALLSSEADLSSRAIRETLKRQFYFDLAGFPFPDQIHGILRIVGPEKLLYGSDFPFTSVKLVASMVETMTTDLEELFPESAVREQIYEGNARKVLKMSSTDV